MAKERSAIVRLREAKQQLEEAGGKSAEAAARKELVDAKRALAEVQESIQEASADLDSYPVPDFLEPSFGDGKALIAVTGASGVGKSSWINAIRRVKATSPDAARTGITETTKEPQMFTFCPGRAGVFQGAFQGVGKLLRSRHSTGEDGIQCGDRLRLVGAADGEVAEVLSYASGSELEVRLDNGEIKRVHVDQVSGLVPEFVLWDLPGVGTSNFPQSTYIRQMGIRHFDMVVLMTATRFTEAELMLVEELKVWNVPFFLVRNKIDADVLADIEDSGEECEIGEDACEAQEQRTIDRIKEYFSSEHSLDNIYCISTRIKHRKHFDFQRLEADMEEAVRKQRVVEVHPLGLMYAGREYG